MKFDILWFLQVCFNWLSQLRQMLIQVYNNKNKNNKNNFSKLIVENKSTEGQKKQPLPPVRTWHFTGECFKVLIILSCDHNNNTLKCYSAWVNLHFFRVGFSSMGKSMWFFTVQLLVVYCEWWYLWHFLFVLHLIHPHFSFD